MQYTEGWTDGYRQAKEDLLEQLEIAANESTDVDVIYMYSRLIDLIEDGNFLELQDREED
mgnify:FL=1|jgi:hypothetical protein